MKPRSIWLIAACAIIFAALSAHSAAGPEESSPISLDDVTSQSGIRFRTQASRTSRKYLVEAMVGGVAMLDFDGDGLMDLYFVNGAALQDPMPPGGRPDKSDPKYWNRLYRNNGDGTFTDVTVKAGVQGAGYGMGAAVGDYDNDGRPDLYVTNYGRNILYHNNGDGTFSDVTDAAGVAGEGWSTGAMFIDYDRDGKLDLAVSRYLTWDFSKDIFCGDNKPGYRAYCHPDQFPPISHLLYHNEGGGKFKDVSRESGFSGHPGKGLGVAMNDYDGDGWPDIFVANDSAPQQLFHNLHNGKFEEVALVSGVAYDEDGHVFAGMGTDFADYDNDGWPDIFVNALANQRYALFHNIKGMFSYISGPSGLGSASQAHSGWGAHFADFDNDGWKDLFVGQGHVMDNIELTQPYTHYLEPPLLLRNAGGRFQDISASAGSVFHESIAARGVAFGDLYNNGSVDVAINCDDGPAIIARNRGNANHWLTVDTEGVRSNRDGIGARLHLVSENGREQYAMVSTAGSYLSASDKRVHFGLGSVKRVSSIEIRWPSGIVQKLSDVPVDRILHVREPRQ
ncbi:MAG: CRTAC1 family protein [Acidobacteriota bacterium]|nr:CRTAC1 family protein [Acidobacteriota bacterium]